MKLFVAKLNREVTDDHLIELFSEYGEVAYARVITDRDTGQSKCFGFVQMQDATAGQAALEALNGHELLGFRMVVKEAEDRPRDASNSNRPSRDSSGSKQPFARASSSESRTPNVRGDNGAEFSRHGDSESESKKEPRKKSNSKKGKTKGGRDIYADGPKPAKMKQFKPKNTDWLDDLDDF